MTKTFKPMLAEAADLDTIRFPLIASAKIDGIRCLIDPVLGPVSRKLKPIPNRHIRGQLATAGAGWFDGEIVTYTSGRLDDFNTIQSKVMSEDGEPEFSLIAFDYFLSPDAPYRQRLNALETLRAAVGHNIHLHTSIEVADMVELMAFEQSCVDAGWEGIMTRDPDGRYKFGRSTAKEQILLKIKRFEDDEAVVTGMVERMHNANEAQKDELGRTKRSSAKNGLVPTGTMGALQVSWRGVDFEIGTGFDEDQRVKFWIIKDKLVGKIVTFKFQGVCSQGRPRFPVFKGLRDIRDLAA